MKWDGCVQRIFKSSEYRWISKIKITARYSRAGNWAKKVCIAIQITKGFQVFYAGFSISQFCELDSARDKRTLVDFQDSSYLVWKLSIRFATNHLCLFTSQRFLVGVQFRISFLLIIECGSLIFLFSSNYFTFLSEVEYPCRIFCMAKFHSAMDINGWYKYWSIRFICISSIF